MARHEEEENDDEFAVGADEPPAPKSKGQRALASAPKSKGGGSGTSSASSVGACTAGSWGAALAAAALALAIFARPAQLDGALLYDDKAAVLGSPVVQGQVPVSKVWTRDFWGKDEMGSPESHKSYRPLVTLTYVANHRLNTQNGRNGDTPFGFHVVSAALHALVSALVVPTVHAALGWRERGLFVPALSALLFAAHPVHVESVQNMVGRAEEMMALFYLLGFLAYAHLVVGGPAAAGSPALAPTRVGAGTLQGLALVLVCTLAAMLCKETGVTLPVLCVGWDVLVVVGAKPVELLSYLTARDGRADTIRRRAPSAAARYAILATGCVLLALWRRSLNGESPAEFARRQNMAIWHPHPLWRACSIVWVWMEYIWVCFFPTALSCDWSWPAITTIDNSSDVRAWLVAAYLLGWGWLLQRNLLQRTSVGASVCFLFAICPFFLASNVLVGVGTCKAERVLYLPSLGACMALALLLRRLDADELLAELRPRRAAGPREPSGGAWTAGLLLVAVYSKMCIDYANVWRTGISLWEHALATQEARPSWMRTGPTTHAVGEVGLQLSWADRNAEAEPMLERQLRMQQAEYLVQLAGGTGLAGGAADEELYDMGGYGPLALVYRMNGDPFKALATTERAIAKFEEARAAGKGEQKMRDLGLTLGARALALYLVHPELAMPEMVRALALSNGKNPVVLKLHEQLTDAYVRAGLDPSKPYPAQTPNPNGISLLGGAKTRASLLLPTAAGQPGAAGAAGEFGALEPAMATAAERDPVLAALLADPAVRHKLAEIRVNPGAVAKYAGDFQLLDVARRLQAAGGAVRPAGPIAPQGPRLGAPAARAKLPVSLSDLDEWVKESRRPADAPPPVELGSVAPDGRVHSELGPLPNYATGAAGDPMDTKAGDEPRLESALPLRASGPSEDIAAATASFKAGANLANGGDVPGAIPHYCEALARFSRCLEQQVCLVGVADTLYIKMRLHSVLGERGVESAAVGQCTARTATRLLTAISAKLRPNDAQSVEYVSGVSELVSQLAAKMPAMGSFSQCSADDSEAFCGRPIKMQL
ncbi:hypothetical protein T492DRAFT_1082900 [Pavlovales sp. CCMP2436]|nr:hypothetical protein T492DRAFT_1082900 [Pavlovales sp. CCMP2436]